MSCVSESSSVRGGCSTRASLQSRAWTLTPAAADARQGRRRHPQRRTTTGAERNCAQRQAFRTYPSLRFVPPQRPPLVRRNRPRCGDIGSSGRLPLKEAYGGLGRSCSDTSAVSRFPSVVGVTGSARPIRLRGVGGAYSGDGLAFGSGGLGRSRASDSSVRRGALNPDVGGLAHQRLVAIDEAAATYPDAHDERPRAALRRRQRNDRHAVPGERVSVARRGSPRRQDPAEGRIADDPTP